MGRPWRHQLVGKIKWDTACKDWPPRHKRVHDCSHEFFPLFSSTRWFRNNSVWLLDSKNNEFTVPRGGNNLCPSMDEWINKLWQIHIMEYYLAWKRNDILMHATTWKCFEAMTLSEINQSQKVILYNSTHIKYLKWSEVSLAVQWLRLCASTAGGMGSIPGWGIKIPCAMECGI